MKGIDELFFQFIGVFILVGFYTIYLGKMYLQRRKGIQTDQIAKGEKSKALFCTELIMKVATYGIVIVQIISIYKNTATSIVPIKIIGAVLGVLGVVVFGIAVHTMKDSWRAGIPASDETELVTNGIFRFSRNPAFLAFDLVYLGVLCLFFNWVLFLFTVFAMLMLHLQIRQEEKFLNHQFGEKYQKYKQHTRRYI